MVNGDGTASEGRSPSQGRSPVAAQAPHPMNSSRLVLELLSLGQAADGQDGWDAAIHRSAMRRLMLALQYRDPAIVQHSRRVAVRGTGPVAGMGNR